ncbi:MAG: UvrD-helicase domain-containing protein [Clostridia bacterium]|nr:UvrD-helicase domain-containing protein [Clostridia bacterium]
MANEALATGFAKAKRQLFEKMYGRLNEGQRQAVFAVNGPLLVLAGAGTGKTTVLVNRIAHIIRFGDLYESEECPADMTEEEISRLTDALSLGEDEIAQVLADYVTSPCPPWDILCFTFTNKAANEMKTRLAATLGEETASAIWAGTFHSVCMRLLRKYGESIGYSKDFTIYDTEDSKRCIKECMKELGIDEGILSVKSALSEINRLKEKLVSPQDYPADSQKDQRSKRIALIYALYQKKLLDASAVDFDDIIMQTVRLLQENDEAFDFCNGRFRYVSVDEFQDTNPAQLRLIKLMTQRRRNVMVVGDDDQSIYRFRGATIENILNFDSDYPDARVVRIEENYRSTENILTAANGIIANNLGRHSKKLFTNGPAGEKVVHKKCETQLDEAKFIAGKVLELSMKEKRRYSDFAVLYRMNSQSNVIESVLSRSGIPYRLVGGTRFYERKEIKDILAYLAIVNNPADDLRLRRIINEPRRKIGDKLVGDIEMIASANAVSMFQIVRDAAYYPQICKSAQRLSAFADLIEELRRIRDSAPLDVLFEKTIELSGYREMLVSGGEEEAEKLQNVEELISNAQSYQSTAEDPSLSGFLEEVALMSDIDNYDSEGNAVSLMTVHSAKGLEFPIVFIPGFEENIFPPGMSLEEDNTEEERRLAYVAVTRAKERVYIITAHERTLFGRTNQNRESRFLREIPRECIEVDETARPGDRRQASSLRPNRLGTVSREFSNKSALRLDNSEKVSEAFGPGTRVVHPFFGAGTVISVTDMGGDYLYSVAFDDIGTKKLMASYAKLKKE